MIIRPFYWEIFAKKLKEKIDRLGYVGFFSMQEAQEKNMRLATGRETNSLKEEVCLYWLVDESDGVIADAKFQAFGPIGLIAAAEIVSELVLSRNQLRTAVAQNNRDLLTSVDQRVNQVTSEIQDVIMQTRLQPSLQSARRLLVRLDCTMLALPRAMAMATVR